MRELNTLARIVHAVHKETGIASDHILSGRRDKATAEARHMVVYLARKYKMRYVDIAQALCYVDHTGPLLAEKKIAREYDDSKRMKKMIDSIKKSLTQR